MLLLSWHQWHIFHSIPLFLGYSKLSCSSCVRGNVLLPLHAPCHSDPDRTYQRCCSGFGHPSRNHKAYRAPPHAQQSPQMVSLSKRTQCIVDLSEHVIEWENCTNGNGSTKKSKNRMKMLPKLVDLSLSSSSRLKLDRTLPTSAHEDRKAKISAISAKNENEPTKGLPVSVSIQSWRHIARRTIASCAPLV